MDFGRYLEDVTQRDKTKWLDGPSISKEDMDNGTGAIQHITVAEMFAKEYNWSAPKGDTMTFGKYKGQTKQEVEERDPDYFDWCLENVKGFTK